MDIQNWLKKVAKLVIGAVGLYIAAIILNIILALFISEPQTLVQAGIRYLPVNIIMLLIAWETRDVKELGITRGIGITAAWQALVQFPPSTRFALTVSGFKFGITPSNAFGKLISMDGGFLSLPLYIAGSVLGVFAFYLYADNLTKRVLSFIPSYTWDEVVLSVATFTLVILLHEGGHVIAATVQGVPVNAVGVMFPVGGYTKLGSVSSITIPGFWFLLMGGNLVTLTLAFLSKHFLYNKFIRYTGIIASVSTTINAAVNFLVGSSDGTRVFLTFWDIHPLLGIATAIIQGLMVFYATKLFWEFLGREAYGSLQIYHDTGTTSEGLSSEIF